MEATFTRGSFQLVSDCLRKLVPHSSGLLWAGLGRLVFPEPLQLLTERIWSVMELWGLGGRWFPSTWRWWPRLVWTPTAERLRNQTENLYLGKVISESDSANRRFWKCSRTLGCSQLVPSLVRSPVRSVELDWSAPASWRVKLSCSSDKKTQKLLKTSVYLQYSEGNFERILNRVWFGASSPGSSYILIKRQRYSKNKYSIFIGLLNSLIFSLVLGSWPPDKKFGH